ncbi:MAG TPA: ABC transporter ATP-binding protein [Acidimicrobiales bacterium]|nr:ABC transporter ATP-binding protein [Acidimicrobiales bacterium]
MSETILEVTGVTAGFGPTTVLHGVDLTVPAGQVAGVFGLNGAGKSVTMKVLAGLVPARSGTVRFLDDDVTSASPEDRVLRGMAHVPQGRQVFAALSVEQNLRLGAYALRRRDRSRYQGVLDGVFDRFPTLAERRTQLAGTMSGGQQAALAVARSLMSEPTLVLVDEPSAGLSPMAVQDLFGTLREVARTGVTMVLVEQNVAFGLQLVDTVHVLQVGRVVHRGPVAGLDQEALAGYLGIGRLLGGGVATSIAGRATTTATRRRTRRRREGHTTPAVTTTAATNGKVH